MELEVYDKKMDKTMDNDLSNTKDLKDYEKFYKKDFDGCYTLHFLNKDKLSIDEIEKIFSVYGKVITINVTKNDNGLRFVKYKTLDEIICCIRGLTKDNIIQLLPERSKIIFNSNNRLDKKNLSQQATRMENLIKRKSNPDKQINSVSFAHNKKFSEIESSTYNEKISNEDDQFDDTDNFSDIGSKSSMHSFKSSAIKRDKLNPLVSNLLSLRQNSVNNSLNKIDYEKYYKIGKDGTYIVHFANKKELDIEEIKRLFSFYGNVVSIYISGNKLNGLVFVRYKTLKETITCLKGLQNNNVICILPQKDKINGTMKIDQRNSNHRQSAETQDSIQGSNKQFKSTFQYDEFSEVREKLIHNTTFDQNKFDNTNNSDIDSQSLNYDHKCVSVITHSDFLLPNEQHLLPLRQESFNYKISDDREQQMKFYSSPSDINTSMNKDTSDNKIPALISDTEIKRKKFNVMSNSSSQFKTKNASSNIMIIPLQEVIVANIHENYDLHYILHLFKKYNPISATLAETILETNIRYCHVYFKTMQDATTVEEEFDNFNLSGKNLIVLCIARLMEEACK